MFFEMRDPFFLYKKWPEQSKLVLFINGRQQIPCLLLEKKVVHFGPLISNYLSYLMQKSCLKLCDKQID